MGFQNESQAIEGQRLGRRVPTPKPKGTLNLGRYLTGTTTVPPSADHITGVPSWNMGGNNRFSTCGPTSLANYMTMMYWNLYREHVTVTDDDVFELYRRSGNPNFNPATDADDKGVDMVQLMEAFQSGGIWITRQNGTRENHKPLAFASLETHDMASIKAATAIFGGVIFGLSLDVAQQNQAIWDFVPGSGAWGGHAVMGGSYSGSPGANGDEVVITWQLPKATTDGFIIKQDEEAYIPIMPEITGTHSFIAGVNLAALSADYTALTDRPFPDVPPVPAPSPVPVPAPSGPPATPEEADAQLAAAVREFHKHRHTGASHVMDMAGMDWLTARRL